MSASPTDLPPGHNDRVKATLTKAMLQLDQATTSLDENRQRVALIQKQLKALFKSYEKKMNRLTETINSTAIGTAAGGDSQGKLLEVTKQMQETQVAFNVQYQQLQSQMQHENRSYRSITAIMKTKHDTVKNSISNIR